MKKILFLMLIPISMLLCNEKKEYENNFYFQGTTDYYFTVKSLLYPHYIVIKPITTGETP